MIAPDKLAELRQMRAAANATLATAIVESFEAVREPFVRMHADTVRAVHEIVASRKAAR